MALEPTRRPFTVDEYHRMFDTGILTRDDRVELLGGEIVEMTPIGPTHAGCVKRLTRLLIERLGRRAVVGVQDPVILDDLSEPQPDLSVARPRDDDYSRAHPRPSDLLLVIEVADTTQAFDRNVKVPRYAATGVPEVWLVDLDSERIEAYRAPTPDGYAQRSDVARDGALGPEAFADVELSVDEILGPADRG